MPILTNDEKKRILSTTTMPAVDLRDLIVQAMVDWASPEDSEDEDEEGKLTSWVTSWMDAASN